MIEEFILVIITWYGTAVPTFMHELPMKNERTCTRQAAERNVAYEAARDLDPLFGFIVECEKREKKK